MTVTDTYTVNFKFHGGFNADSGNGNPRFSIYVRVKDGDIPGIFGSEDTGSISVDLMFDSNTAGNNVKVWLYDYYDNDTPSVDFAQGRVEDFTGAQLVITITGTSASAEILGVSVSGTVEADSAPSSTSDKLRVGFSASTDPEYKFLVEVAEGNVSPYGMTSFTHERTGVGVVTGSSDFSTHAAPTESDWDPDYYNIINEGLATTVKYNAGDTFDDDPPQQGSTYYDGSLVFEFFPAFASDEDFVSANYAGNEYWFDNYLGGYGGLTYNGAFVFGLSDVVELEDPITELPVSGGGAIGPSQRSVGSMVLGWAGCRPMQFVRHTGQANPFLHIRVRWLLVSSYYAGTGADDPPYIIAKTTGFSASTRGISGGTAYFGPRHASREAQTWNKRWPRDTDWTNGLLVVIHEQADNTDQSGAAGQYAFCTGRAQDNGLKFYLDRALVTAPVENDVFTIGGQPFWAVFNEQQTPPLSRHLSVGHGEVRVRRVRGEPHFQLEVYRAGQTYVVEDPGFPFKRNVAWASITPTEADSPHLRDFHMKLGEYGVVGYLVSISIADIITQGYEYLLREVSWIKEMPDIHSLNAQGGPQ